MKSRRITLWTVEKPKANGGVHVDDLKLSEREARKEVERRGPPWRAAKIRVKRGCS